MATHSESRNFFCQYCGFRVDGVYEAFDSWQNFDEVLSKPSLVNFVLIFALMPIAVPWFLFLGALQGKLHCPACGNPQAQK